jgi:glycosyltransferase involved in cell wall biosynthesis
MLLKAWATLRPSGWQVIIAGPDEAGHKLEVEQEARRLGVESDFLFVGELAGSSKERAYLQADLFILPSYSENFGMVVAEALSHGLPVITTHGTPWGMLQDLNAGWWVEGSVPGVTSGLRQALATTPEERARMGQRGRSYVQSSLGWPSVSKLTAEAYGWVLRDHESRPAHVHVD